MALQDYWMENIRFTPQIQDFLQKWHYATHTAVQHKETFGLYRPGNFNIPELIGVCVYTRPAGASAAKKYWPDNPDKCLELRRLCLIDDTPKNAESYFVSRTIKWLKKHTDWEYIISYADPEEGHSGVIYRASNFKYDGVTGEGKVLSVDGERFHIRTLSMLDRPYGREINERYKAGDAGIQIITTQPKHIYTYKLIR
jgi:hypothetical protein